LHAPSSIGGREGKFKELSNAKLHGGREGKFEDKFSLLKKLVYT